MQIENVESYVKLLKENGLSELKLKTDEFELYIKKEGVISEVTPVAMATTAQPVAQPAVATPALAPTAATSGQEVKSPIVGVIYLTPEPGKPPYVNVGDYVKKGQKLAIISAMKVMNDFVSPVDGVIREITVQSEDVVEFDQVLFIIE